MARRDGRWLIYDVVADGSSMVGNYRAQFTHIMKTASYTKLVEKLTTQ
ncbi:MAG: ABC transporter substrate-binding protein [Candidatus Rokubacteria bacterium]|nr:ABC transporter substrate-binding protein [Candidatus Rokubacteria bacterium]MBI2493997.1 ABC transporter substrate-binding protein [Candidatus Rokubacteria bacterium]